MLSMRKRLAILLAGLMLLNSVAFAGETFEGHAEYDNTRELINEELFTDKNKLLRFVVKILGAFAVNREKPEVATFKTVFDIVKNI